MLVITGKVLGVATEQVTPQNSAAFETHTVTLQAGVLPSGRPRIEDVRLGRDVEPVQFSEVGEEVTCEVYVQTYPRKGGGVGYRLVALTKLDAAKGLRAAV